MNTRHLLVVLFLPFLASCGSAKNSEKVGIQNEGEIKLFDFDGYTTAATPGGAIKMEPSQISKLKASFDGGGGSVAFTAGGRSSSFVINARSSSMTASGRAQTFKLTSVSSTFRAAAPTASTAGSSFGSFSGNCDWEAAVRAFFTSLYSVGRESTSRDVAAAASEANVSELRTYMSDVEPRAVCLVAGIYSCLGDSIRSTSPTATAMGGCILNVCNEVAGVAECGLFASAFSGAAAGQ